MRLLRNILIAISLSLGLIGALTAYRAPLSLPDERLIGLELNAPAGVRTGDDGKPAPIVRKDELLTAEHLATLRGAGVRGVRVTSFSLRRWQGWPFFLAGFAGLLVAGVAMRPRPVGTGQAAPGVGSDAGPAVEVPVGEMVARLRTDLETLRSELATVRRASGRERLIMDRLGVAIGDTIPPIIGSRARITQSIGLAGYARFMDAFAAAERQINRAWSAAADEATEEAEACVDRAIALLGEASARL